METITRETVETVSKGTIRSWAYYASSNGTSSYWEFSWTSTQTRPGETLVEWTLMTKGRTAGLDRLWTTCTLYIDQGKEGSDATTQVYHYDNYAYFSDWVAETGSFTIKDEDGQIGPKFGVKLDVPHIYTTVIPYGESRVKSETYYIDRNFPYTKCSWSADASVVLTGLNGENEYQGAYIAPIHKIRVSWTGAQPGVNNEIAEYKVNILFDETSYGEAKISGFNYYDYVFPDDLRDEFRGKKISASVTIIGKKEGYASEPKTSTIKVYVNNRPGEPILASKNVIVKSTDIEFTPEITVGKDADNQLLSLYYNNNGSLVPFDSPIDVKDINGSLKVEFYSYDGLEFSDKVELTITKNSIPGLTIKYSYGEAFTISGLKEGKLVIAITTNIKKIERREEIGSDESSNEKTYNFRVFLGEINSEEEVNSISVKLNDGIEIFEDNKNNISYIFPKFIIRNSLYQPGQEVIVLNGYCGNSVKLYEDKNFKNIDVTEINEGSVISQIKGDGYFIIPENRLTKIRKLSLDLEKSIIHKPYVNPLILNSPIKGGSLDPFGSPAGFEFWLDGGRKVKVDLSNSSSNDIIIFNFSQEDSYAIALSDNGTLTGNKLLFYSYVNAFDEKVEFETTTAIKIDWSAPARLKTTSGESQQLVNNFAYLMENMDPGFKLDLVSFYKPYCYIEKESTSNKWIYFTNVDTEEKTEELTGNYGFNTKVNLKTYSLSVIIPAILKTEECKLRLVVETEGNKVIFDLGENNFKLKRFTTPLIQFTDVVYQNNKIIGHYEIIDWGLDPEDGHFSFKIQGKIRESGNVYEGSSEGVDIVSFNYAFGGKQDVIYIAPILQVSWGDGEYSIQKKTIEDIYMVCYNITPTVSYRQNHIGINTNQIDETEYQKAVAIISQYKDRGVIYFSGINDGSNLFSTLDLTTMGLSGFVVDCGSWDDTPGGVIPGGGSGSVPTGLAAIAYSGEIGDLEQEREDIIIFTGGSAGEI